MFKKTMLLINHGFTRAILPVNGLHFIKNDMAILSLLGTEFYDGMVFKRCQDLAPYEREGHTPPINMGAS